MFPQLTCKAPKRCIPTTLPLIEAAPLSLPCIEVRSTSIPRSEALSLVLPQCEDLTCFTDAAWNTFSGSCGMRWIFKTQHERVIHQGSSSRLHTPSTLAVEAFAFKSALTAALRMEFTSITVCLDSQVLISLLNTETTSNELQGILHDITCLCRSLLYLNSALFHV
ncbi:putative ribonuclease H domain-containing protein [Arabidopsis thaliana]